MDQAQLNWLTNFIWNIADDVLRDVYQPPQLCTLAEISASILALEQETEGPFSEITGGAGA